MKDGAEDIKNHKWFKGVDWTKAANRQMKPPFVPAFKSPDVRVPADLLAHIRSHRTLLISTLIRTRHRSPNPWKPKTRASLMIFEKRPFYLWLLQAHGMLWLRQPW
jgi:hypothetical protein